jgi:hypothetical protein
MAQSRTAAVILGAALALLAWQPQARAEVQRYALVVGANQGTDQEPLLRYAERDASRVAKVLRTLGDISPENLVLLTNTDAPSVARVMSDLRQRIALHRQSHPDDETLLVIFYSGHADAQGLNLNGTQLGFSQLKEALRQSPAHMRVLILDACRSGEITRVKGAKPAAPFRIEPIDAMAGEGMAIITSSTSHEDAQESDRLQASFFTHHLVSGMLGAADASRDRRVTLGEAYAYAYNETLRSTSRARFVQHPTYWFEIKGRQDLVLTSLRRPARSMARLKLLDQGSYVLFREGHGGPLAAELSASEGTEIALEEGTYLIRRRGADAVQETTTHLAANQEVSLAIEDMERIPYGRMVRKGLGTESELALGLTSGVGVSGALVEGTGQVLLGQVGAQLDLEPLSLQWRLRYGTAQRSNDSIGLTQDVLGTDVAALKLFDVSSLSLGFGVRLGGDWIRQSFRTQGQAPDRDTFTLRAAPLIHVGMSPWSLLHLYLEASGDAYLFTVQGEENASTELRFVPQAMAGVLLYLP